MPSTLIVLFAAVTFVATLRLVRDLARAAAAWHQRRNRHLCGLCAERPATLRACGECAPSPRRAPHLVPRLSISLRSIQGEEDD